MVTQTVPAADPNLVRDPKTMHLEADVDVRDVVVFDIGGHRTKIGMAGQDVCFAAFLSVLKEVGVSLADQGDGSQYLEVVDFQQMGNANDHNYIPFDRSDVHHVEPIFRYGLQQLIDGGFVFSEVHALMAEAPGVTLAHRQLAVSKIFQVFQNVKSIAVINSAVLSLFSTGQTKGLVVDLGHSCISVVPVFEGFAIPHATFTSSQAGLFLSQKMKESCRAQDPQLYDGLSIQDFQAMVERCCRILPLSDVVCEFIDAFLKGFESSQLKTHDLCARAAEEMCESGSFPAELQKFIPDVIDEWLEHVQQQPGADFPSTDTMSLAQRIVTKLNNTSGVVDDRKSFELPDGRVVDLSEIGAEVGDALFDSTGDVSVTDIVFSAIAACDHELQMDLIKHMVIVGGTSLLPGFCARFKMELEVRILKQISESRGRALLHPDLGHVEINMRADSSRKEAAWLGGSMFASLSTYSHFAVKREDFETGGRFEMNVDLAEKAF